MSATITYIIGMGVYGIVAVSLFLFVLHMVRSMEDEPNLLVLVGCAALCLSWPLSLIYALASYRYNQRQRQGKEKDDCA